MRVGGILFLTAITWLSGGSPTVALAGSGSACLPGTFEVGDNILISTNGSYQGANGSSDHPAVSDDGRFVMFESRATNLVIPNATSYQNVFRYDMKSGAITPQSISSGGAYANGFNWTSDISGDGRYVTFSAQDANLDPQAPPSGGYIAMHDNQTGETRAIPASWSGGGSITADGRYIVYINGPRLYLYDAQTNTSEAISQGAYDPPNSQNGYMGAVISGDGRYVIFSTFVKTLVPNDTNGTEDVFLFDRQTRTTERISVASNGAQGNGRSSILTAGTRAVSDDGRYVVFRSEASNLVEGDSNGKRDIFLRDRQTGATVLVSKGLQGVPADNHSYDPSISGNGRYVTFTSTATNIVQRIRSYNTVWAVYIYDVATGDIDVASLCVNGDICRGFHPAINRDGSIVAFASDFGQLVTSGWNGIQGVFIQRRKAVACEPTDATPPVVIPPLNVTVEATGTLTQVDIGTATATDDVGVVSVTSDAPAAGYPLGATTVTWTAKDAAGNSGTANQTVTVVDTTPPTLEGPANLVVEAPSTAGVQVAFTVTARDIVDPAPVVSCSPASGSLFPLGETTVTSTARDFKNNSATGSFTIKVQDSTPPVLAVPTDKAVEATAPLTPVAIGQATATDIFPVKVISDAPVAYSIGTTTVNWTATDANNNVATGIQKVTVKDATAPVVTPPANLTVEATGMLTQVNIGTATATDAVGVVSITSNAPATFPVGATIVTWTAKDAAGNVGTTVQTVTVKDTTPPALEGLANQLLEATSASGAKAAYTVTAKDLVDPAPTVICSAASGSTFPLGATVVTCTARDGKGNNATGSFTITVRDATPPVLTVPADITVLLNTPLSAPAVQEFFNGATAIDLVDSTVTVTFTAPESLNSVGAKLVIFTAVDDYGNKTTHTATIYVKYGCGDDFLPPVNLLKPFKQGSTIPVKFALCDANGSPVTSAVARLYLQRYSGDEPVGEPIEATSTSGADIGNYFRGSEGIYIYNLFTKNLSAGTYQIRVLLDDGAVNTIPLSLKQ